MMTVRENSRCPGKLKSQMNNGMCLKYCMGCEKVKVLVTQSFHTLCDPLVCSPPRSSVYGILQARILEWIAISFSNPVRNWGDIHTKMPQSIVGLLMNRANPRD